MVLEVALFVLCINNRNAGKDTIWTEIGKEYSLGIFLVHQPVGFFLHNIFGVSEYLLLISTVLLSLVIIYLYKSFKNVSKAI